MGNSVTVNFLTDHWHEVRKDPETLVEAIDSAMHYGNESMVNAAQNTLHYRDSPRPKNWPLNHYAEQQHLRTHYVTVHRFRHADERQIVYNHANSSYDVGDFTHGVECGFLETVGNPETYVRIGRSMAEELRYQADKLDAVLNKWEKDNPLKKI